MEKNSPIEFQKELIKFLDKNWNKSELGKFPPTNTRLRNLAINYVKQGVMTENFSKLITELFNLEGLGEKQKFEKLNNINSYKWIENCLHGNATPTLLKMEKLKTVLSVILKIQDINEVILPEFTSKGSKSNARKLKTSNPLAGDYNCFLEIKEPDDLDILHIKIETDADGKLRMRIKLDEVYYGEVHLQKPFLWARLSNSSDTQFINIILQIGVLNTQQSHYVGTITIPDFSQKTLQTSVVILKKRDEKNQNLDHLKPTEKKELDNKRKKEVKDLFIYMHPSKLIAPDFETVVDILNNQYKEYDYLKGIFFTFNETPTWNYIKIKKTKDNQLIFCKVMLSDTMKAYEFEGNGKCMNDKCKPAVYLLRSDSNSYLTLYLNQSQFSDNLPISGLLQFHNRDEDSKIHFVSHLMLHESNEDEYKSNDTNYLNDFSMPMKHQLIEKHSISKYPDSSSLLLSELDFPKKLDNVFGVYTLYYLSPNDYSLTISKLEIHRDFTADFYFESEIPNKGVLKRNTVDTWQMIFKRFPKRSYTLEITIQSDLNKNTVSGIINKSTENKLNHIRCFLIKHDANPLNNKEADLMNKKIYINGDLTGLEDQLAAHLPDLKLLANIQLAEDATKPKNIETRLAEEIENFEFNQKEKEKEKTASKYYIYHIHDDRMILARSVLYIYSDNTAIIDNRLTPDDTSKYRGVYEVVEMYYQFRFKSVKESRGNFRNKKLNMSFLMSTNDEISLGVWNNLSNNSKLIGGIAVLHRIQEKEIPIPKIFEKFEDWEKVSPSIREFLKFKSQNLLRIPENINTEQRLFKFVSSNKTHFWRTGQYMFTFDVFLSCPINSEKNEENVNLNKEVAEGIKTKLEQMGIGNIFVPILEVDGNKTLEYNFVDKMNESKMQIAFFTATISAGVAFEISWFIKSKKPCIIFVPGIDVIPVVLRKLYEMNNTHFKIIYYKKLEEIPALLGENTIKDFLYEIFLMLNK